jgi:SpoVK/Ycf46/Vps4 family AAA+-type ATPase
LATEDLETDPFRTAQVDVGCLSWLKQSPSGIVGFQDGRRAMAANAEHLKALIQSHMSGDETRFEAVTLQVAAKAARQGQHQLALDLKKLLESTRREVVSPRRGITALAQPRGDVADLVTASYPETQLADLVVSDELVGQLNRVVLEQRQQERLQAHGLVPVHRLLLTGPPGTGKTMSARALAHELSVPLLEVRLDSVLSKYMGETAAKLRVVFDAAAEQRAVFLFDEFDALGADRSGSDVGEARRVLNSFLVFLENAPTHSVIVAATNHPELLDRALFRRFDLAINFTMPSLVACREIVKRRLRGLSGPILWKKLDELIEGRSPAELVSIAESAAKDAILGGDAKVGTAHLLAALAERSRVAGG